MSKVNLSDMSLADLEANYSRLLHAVEDLQFCLVDVEEEYDELQSTNAMLKSTINSIKSRNSLSNRLFNFLKRPSLTPRESLASTYQETPRNTKKSAFVFEEPLSAHKKLQRKHGKGYYTHREPASAFEESSPLEKKHSKKSKYFTEEINLPKHFERTQIKDVPQIFVQNRQKQPRNRKIKTRLIYN